MSLARKLLHTRYRVNDLERTVKFYREVLGLEELRRHKSPRGSELAFLKAPESPEQAASVALHAKFHFQKVGQFRHVGFKFDRWLDVVYMELLLQSASGAQAIERLSD